MRVAIVGGGAAGLFSALLLARAGHDVAVFERDRLECATDLESAAARAYRKTAPQIVQPHVIMARCRQLLLQWMPDVYLQLLGAGVIEAPLSTQMPPTLFDTANRPDDEQFTMLMTRRSTFDFILQRAAIAQQGISLHYGVRVIGLLSAGGNPPHVHGIRTEHGDVVSDVVVDASGYRSQIDRWLRDIGSKPTVKWSAECGIAYFSRHYSIQAAAELPGPPASRILAALDEFTVGIWGADNRVMQVAVAPLAVDHRFKTLTNPGAFSAVLRSIPTYAAWLNVLDPISGIFTMGAVANTLRRLVVDGVPVATGLVALGDSVCTTNPTLGRGLTLALVGGVGLLQVIERHGKDRGAQALAMDELVVKNIAPFYDDQAAIDAARLAMLRHKIFDAPAPAVAKASPNIVSFGEIRAAAFFEPTVFRALWNIMGMLKRPQEVYTDTRVVECTHRVLLERRVPAIAQPTREQLLAALAS